MFSLSQLPRSYEHLFWHSFQQPLASCLTFTWHQPDIPFWNLTWQLIWHRIWLTIHIVWPRSWHLISFWTYFMPTSYVSLRVTKLLTFDLTYLLASLLIFFSGIRSDAFLYVGSDMPSDIISEIPPVIYTLWHRIKHLFWHCFWRLVWHSVWHFITISLTSCQTINYSGIASDILSDMAFWHDFWLGHWDLDTVEVGKKMVKNYASMHRVLHLSVHLHGKCYANAQFFKRSYSCLILFAICSDHASEQTLAWSSSPHTFQSKLEIIWGRGQV